MSTESSLLNRRFPCEPDTRPFIPGSLPRLMVLGKWLKVPSTQMGVFLTSQSSLNSSTGCTVKPNREENEDESRVEAENTNVWLSDRQV